MDIDAYAHEFPLDADVVYLNHAGVAPWPRRTLTAVSRFAEDNMRAGARDYPHWVATESHLREQLRGLVNAPHRDDIALLKSTSEALSVVAYGLDWKSGDNIVITDQEFPSNRIPWESLADQGVELRRVSLDVESGSPEDALCAAMDERTRLLSVSSVQYGTGLRLDLTPLGAHCRSQGVLFCVDAIQSLGAVPLDVQAAKVDFAAADGHKWMLGPEGLAAFYCREELRERLRLRQYGWHMVEQLSDFDRLDWTPAQSARRFECGSPNTLGVHALSASLSLLLEIGMPDIFRNVLKNSFYVADYITANENLELISPSVGRRRAGIVTFRPRDQDSAELFRRLSARGVVCARRAGGVRFSPHFYTPREAIDRALDVVDAYLGGS